MKNLNKRVVLIAGATSGIGKALAETLSREGYRIYGTGRSPVKILEGTPETGNTAGYIKMLQMDVCSKEAVDRAVDTVIELENRLDILINCAGFGLAGSVEDTTDEEAFMQLNTNFFGAYRLCRKAASIMRNQGSGIIINISSLAGLIPLPFQAFYSASKHALEAMTQALRMELKAFGIKVVLIEPGDIKTRFTDSRIFVKASGASVYKTALDRSLGRMIRDEQKGPSPDVVVRSVRKAIMSRNPPVRYVVGSTNMALVLLKCILPDRVVEYILSRLYT
ncbi:MAG: SDR family oxidoreductase [Bacillota bacterium]